MKPTLLVLAAGMASRYGSLKQLDGMGPNGETIMDYSIYDAIRAGFGRVVFVIRGAFADGFKAHINAERYGGAIEVEYVYQELEKLPAGFSVPADRTKPWGTNHAVLMGAEVIKNEPFAAINADDFYGREAYQVMGDYLRSVAGGAGRYAMVGYQVSKTLSDFGTVSRGVCEVDEERNLQGMVERHQIKRYEDGVVRFTDEAGEMHPLAEDAPVSMNMFGFTPDYFTHSEEYFSTYLQANIENPTSEFYIPTMVNHLIHTGEAQMQVLASEAEWFGVTYKEDRPTVQQRITQLIEQGIYPANLWE